MTPDNVEFFATLTQAVEDCLTEEKRMHAVLIKYDESTGLVSTYAINASYDVVRTLVQTASGLVCADDGDSPRVQH